ncbi:dynein light intermediate chain-domain-containing protein [Jimgerdemannia flammicorona]|uniref:Dynein light intermediate chain-domain-containing protein n=1 Tax=Jimgerdemannia flammicorona TaxID=994334 RepID=A0A433D8E6_9FUNG|nr:dynein light intermediate chain-domain-containing protein [Jimgerdemannia flammicorona]
MSPNTPSELQLPPEPIPQPSTSTSSIHPGSQGFQANGIEKEEIWSTILTSVASSKLVPAKNVLILGDPHCGKSTLIHHLRHDPGHNVSVLENGNNPVGNLASSHQVTVQSNPLTKSSAVFPEDLDDEKANELALSFTYVDVQDEENEDTIARLGLYQLSLAHPSYQSLLKFALNSSTLPDSLVVILLDWSRPWTFVETLERWIALLERQIDDVCREGKVPGSDSAWAKGRAVVDELKERIEHYVQTYTEPPMPQAGAAAGAGAGLSGFTGPIVPSASTGYQGQMAASLSSTSFVLSPSTSTNFAMAPSTSTSFTMAPSTSMTYGASSGSIPSTPVMTAQHTTTEQVTLPLGPGTLTKNLGIPLVIVCCKSDSLNQLERTQDYKEERFDYIQQTLRTLCLKYGAALFYTSTRHPHTFHYLRQYMLHRLLSTPTKIYHFPSRAQVVERDTVLVPAGWDSWGKIRVLREGFDCEGVNDGWELDLHSEDKNAVNGNAQSVKKVYEEVVPDPHSDDQPLNVQPQITAEDEQAFFEKHYETLQRTTEGPRTGTGSAASTTGGAGVIPGIVGPVGVSAATLGLTDRDIDTEDMANKLAKYTKPRTTPIIDREREQRDLSRGPESSPPNPSPAMGAPSSPHQSGAGSAASGTQHEVLANFFQSLLNKKGGGTASPGGPTSPTGGPPTVPNSAMLPAFAGRHSQYGVGENSSNRDDVREQLDLLKRSVGSSGAANLRKSQGVSKQ